jgi:hypothetical protein
MNEGVLAEQLAAIEHRLAAVEQCVKEIRGAQQKELHVMVKAQREHISDLKEAMRALTSMAGKIKGEDA